MESLSSASKWKSLAGRAIFLFLQPVEQLLFCLLPAYDKYMYGPLSAVVSPYVAKVPRYHTWHGVKYTVFTANIVSCARASLVILAACVLKFGCNSVACLIVLLHDFLDHVDGMVAREQRKIYGAIDDPVLGGFLDAFCDKIFNVLCLWSLLMVVDTSHMNMLQMAVFLFATGSIAFYEFVLGVVRVQDYFQTYYMRLLGNSKAAEKVKISANMAGKLKEKLESFGLAFLCLASSSMNLMVRVDGLAGVVCLLLSVRLAHSSLMHKLNARRYYSDERAEADTSPGARQGSGRANEMGSTTASTVRRRLNTSGLMSNHNEGNFEFFVVAPAVADGTGNEGLELIEVSEDSVVDKVFTIGCFDLFHFGHKKLLKNMRRLGKEVIVGVHDDRSIEQLKQRTPIDSTETRMKNLSKYADQVYCISSKDPSVFFRCAVNVKEGETALFVRGDDMPNFPARDVAEQLMPIRLLPYTNGVSSTMLRQRITQARDSTSGSELEE